MAVGDIKRMGQLFLNNYAQDLNSTINAPYYNYTPNFTFKDTDDYTKQHNWLEFNEGGQKKYICTNGIFYGLRYAELTISFKQIELDGEIYELRIPTESEILYLYENKLLNKVDNKASETGYAHYVTYGSNDEKFTYCANININDNKPTFYHESSINDFQDYMLVIPILVLVNNPPTISGKDENLGDKTSSFSITYSISDEDSDQELTVKEKLNGNIIRTLKNPTQNSTLTFTIADELFASLSMNTTNTIEIEVTDGSATTYRRYTFVKTNSAPFITYTGQADLGELTTKPSITYSVKDNEGDAITVTEKLNGEVINQFSATTNTNYTVGITDTFWLTCGSNTNTVEIIASDALGGSSSKTITFSRKITKLQIVMKNAIETDAKATKILVSPQWTTTGGVGKVEVCNNGFDSNPKWEDATTMVVLNRPYLFTNTSKTASKWGIKIRITVTKNQGYDGEVAIFGFGGAYE